MFYSIIPETIKFFPAKCPASVFLFIESQYEPGPDLNKPQNLSLINTQ